MTTALSQGEIENRTFRNVKLQHEQIRIVKNDTTNIYSGNWQVTHKLWLIFNINSKKPRVSVPCVCKLSSLFSCEAKNIILTAYTQILLQTQDNVNTVKLQVEVTLSCVCWES